MSSETDRIYYLDTMRSILMMLGVVLHSAQVFNPEQTWLISSRNTFWVAGWLVETIHTFRMPAFFIISGFFSMLTLGKSTPNRFIRIRLKRILVPLISTAVTLNVLQTVVLTKTGWLRFEVNSFLAGGEWVSHLWFLNNLIVYFSLVYLTARVIAKRRSAATLERVDLSLRLPTELLILLLPLVSVAILASNSLGFPLYSSFYGVLNTYSLLSNAPYFIFGMLLYLSGGLQRQFTATSPAYLVSGLLLAECLLRYSGYETWQKSLGTLFAAYLLHLKIWLLVTLIFWLFFRYLNKKSGTFYFLSDSSYTVYLFHHLAVVLFGLVLINLDISGLPGLLLLMAMTATVTLLIHRFLVMRSPRLRLLFNGR